MIVAEHRFGARKIFLFLCAICFCSLGWGIEQEESDELIIKIGRGISRSTSIALVPFRSLDDRNMGFALDGIMANNFRLSGHFTQLDRLKYPARPFRKDQIIYKDWRGRGVEYLVFGELSRIDKNRFGLNLSIADMLSERVLAQSHFTFDTAYQRDFAHYVSDYIYEKITGIKGSFSTKLVFVRRMKKDDEFLYGLHLVDADGQREKVLLTSDQPIMSPSWSPDATKLAYVSFESGRSGIYIQEIRSGRRSLITNFRGINGAPAWSPDGKTLAVVLSRSGNADIYLINLMTLKGRRLTQNPAIDTEPSWSADGYKIIFTSDRGGYPQVYQYDFRSAKISLLTQGSYSSRAYYTHEDSALVMIRQINRKFNVVLYDLEDNIARPISTGALDDSPSVSPDGNRVVYSTRVGRYYRLALASVDLGNKVYLSLGGGDLRSPAWSPFIFQHNF